MLILLLMSDRFILTDTPDPVFNTTYTISRQTIETHPVVEPVTFIGRITAYAPFDNKSGMCNDGDPNYTSTGQRPSRRIVAVDPSKIPYGTLLRIEGLDEIFEAGDTGSALRNYDGFAIDLYVDTYREARTWGVQYLEVEVIE